MFSLTLPSHRILRLALLLLIIIATTAQAELDRGDPRISGGMQTKINRVPYLIQLRDNKGILFGTGTLISPEYVLTAAHCFDEIDYAHVVVVGGATKTSEPGVQRKILQVIKHPDYNAETKIADAALLKLDKSMSGHNIRTIELSKRKLKAKDLVQVSGWGGVAIFEPELQILRTARLPVVTQTKCEKEFPGLVTSTMFCASGVGEQAHCFGDSGGPAVFRGRLCGLISKGYKCDQEGHSSGFTDVRAISNFIESNMK